VMMPARPSCPLFAFPPYLSHVSVRSWVVWLVLLRFLFAFFFLLLRLFVLVLFRDLVFRLLPFFPASVGDPPQSGFFFLFHVSRGGVGASGWRWMGVSGDGWDWMGVWCVGEFVRVCVLQTEGGRKKQPVVRDVMCVGVRVCVCVKTKDSCGA
jgi:hypothetical protein